MSKAEKMQKRLASLQKEREEFEKQKQQLEMEMNIGKKNMGKIQKSLKNHLNEIELLDTETIVSASETSTHTSRGGGGHRKATSSKTPTHSHPTGSPPPAAGGTEAQEESHYSIVVPSGPRISEWCFTAPLDSTPPTVKSRELYETVRLLGRGSFGEVNLVKNVEDHKLFAIKSIFCLKDYELNNVQKEIKFLRLNHHPFVIDVHDAFITSNPRVVNIVMHYCESGTLSSIIQSAKKTKTSIAEAQIVKWIVQLAMAMHHLHENKTVHRDLKPMNVMLTEGGDILKLADFGLAMIKKDGDDGENFDEAGTPYYTAPEMIQRESYSFPTDCWSFGVIMYQLLSLERPFDGASTADLVKSILISEPAALPGHYSEDIRYICKELLRKNQSERMTMAQLLCEPSMFGKASAVPQTYRPKHFEDRVRRSHVKQLEQQLEVIGKLRKQLMGVNTGQSGKFSRETSFSGTSGSNKTPRINPDAPIESPANVSATIIEEDSRFHSLDDISGPGSPTLDLKVSTVAHLQNENQSASSSPFSVPKIDDAAIDKILKASEKALKQTAHDKEVINEIMHPGTVEHHHHRNHHHGKQHSGDEARHTGHHHHQSHNSPEAGHGIGLGIDPLQATVDELIDHIDATTQGNVHKQMFKQEDIERFETEMTQLSDMLKVGQKLSEETPTSPRREDQTEQKTTNPGLLSPNSSVVGGRKGLAIAKAIEHDQVYEQQLTSTISTLKEQNEASAEG